MSISSSSLNSSEFSLNSYTIMSKLKTKKLPSFIKKKSTIKKFHKRNSIAYIKKNYMAKEFLKDINEEKIFDLTFIK